MEMKTFVTLSSQIALQTIDNEPLLRIDAIL